MTTLWKAVVCVAVVLPPVAAQGQPARVAPVPDGLPVKRVVLYKNGVGYFEHLGRVRGDQEVTIPLTSAQLNDVLKSLTVLDLNGGRITGVEYGSAAPVERQLGDLRLPSGEKTSITEFLGALRGARLEIRSGTAVISGKLLSVERKTRIAGGTTLEVDYLSLITDSGELRTTELSPSFSVRLLEPGLAGKVDRLLDIVASTRDADVRRMVITTAGSGERSVFVSYISEVPVWKTTYRIVLNSKTGAQPLLQGWAIVDNTVGQDWENVQLSLIAGAPQSFIQNLSQPYYSRRPVVPLPENAMLTPQTHEATMEEGRLEAPNRIAGVVGGVPGGVPGGQMGGVMASIGTGKGAGIGAGSPPPAPPPPHPDASEIAEDLEEGTAVGQSQELGDLFEYKLRDRVTIRKNQSALVPILQTRIDAEKVSVWNPSQDSVLRALWVNNDSSLTLDGGSFNVLEGDAFAGEGLMDAIKPGEKRILSYAADLGLLVDAKEKAASQRVTRISISHGAMIQSTEERQEETYTIRNRDTALRTLIVEHPARAGWKLTDGETPVESSASYHRFRLSIEPKKTETLVVKEYRPVSNRWMLTNVSDNELKFFVDQKMITPDVEKELRSIVKQKNDIAVLDAVITGRRAQVTAITDDQQRVRENMKALKGSAEEKALLERYVRELNEQEDRVQALRKEITEMQQRRDAAQSALNTTIETLQMEATL